jgi:aspartate/methionine/tyrosine aminotransferase
MFTVKKEAFIFFSNMTSGYKGLILVNPKVTKRASNIEYAIRDVIVHTKDLIKNGKKIHYLNIGDPVAFDFKTPSSFKESLCNAIDKEDNYYSPSEGLLELREAVANKEKKINNVNISSEDVLVTEGISEGIQMLLGATVESGDEILFPGPAYPPYISYTKFFDGTPVA